MLGPVTVVGELLAVTERLAASKRLAWALNCLTAAGEGLAALPAVTLAAA
jgi:hypothetical protein